VRQSETLAIAGANNAATGTNFAILGVQNGVRHLIQRVNINYCVADQNALWPSSAIERIE